MPDGLAVLGLQQFESLIQGLVALVGLGRVVVNVVVLGLAHEDCGSNGLILNLLTVGSLELRNGEEKGCAVWEFDGLLDGAFAERAFADDIATFCAADGVSRKFRGAVGTAIDE